MSTGKKKVLRRGKACLNCRFLKIKCDGIKPVCGPCTHIPKDDECEYTDRPSRTQELLDKVSTLQARVLELESQLEATSESNAPSPFSSHSSSFSSSPASSSSFVLDEQLAFSNILEPPGTIIGVLLDNFLPHATQFGFFLHTERFRQATLLPLPLGDPTRPSPALLYAVYLWGTHLSNSCQSQISVFIGRALRQLAIEVSSRVGHSQMIHTIQAQVLLATYFLKNNHLVEADFHTNGAVSLALSYDLHKLGQVDDCDPIAQGEKINAFWAVFCLDRTVKLTLGREACSFGFLENPSDAIETPWPVQLDEYLYQSATRASPTIRNFLSGQVPDSVNETSLFVQSMVVYYKASLLWNRWLRGIRPDQVHYWMTECNAFDELLTNLQIFLPSLPNASSSWQTVFLMHALIRGATIRLDAIYAACGNSESNGRCIIAAQWILDTLGDVVLSDISIVHPIVGALCLVACQTLVNEIKRIGASTDRTLLAEQARIQSVLVSGMASMSVLAGDSAMVAYQLGQVQEVGL